LINGKKERGKFRSEAKKMTLTGCIRRGFPIVNATDGMGVDPRRERKQGS